MHVRFWILNALNNEAWGSGMQLLEGSSAFWKQQVLPRRCKPYTKTHVINSRGHRKIKAVNSSHVRWAYIVRPTVIVSTCLCNYYQIRKPNRMAVV